MYPNASNIYITSPFTDACETFWQASLHIKSPTSTKFPAVQADRGRLLSSRLSIYCCCRFYSATCPDWFSSISCAEIPVAVVQSEIRVANFRQVAPFYVVNLMRLKLKMCSEETVLKYTPKVMQIASSISKTRAVKRSGLRFGPPCKTYALTTFLLMKTLGKR